MGIRDRINKVREHIKNSKGTQRLKGDYAKVRQMAKEHKEGQEVKAQEKYQRQITQTKRVKQETRLVEAQNKLAKAKEKNTGRMSGPFGPKGGGLFGDGGSGFGGSFGNSRRDSDLPGLVGMSSYGAPPGMAVSGASTPRKKKNKRRS